MRTLRQQAAKAERDRNREHDMKRARVQANQDEQRLQNTGATRRTREEM